MARQPPTGLLVRWDYFDGDATDTRRNRHSTRIILTANNRRVHIDIDIQVPALWSLSRNETGIASSIYIKRGVNSRFCAMRTAPMQEGLGD